MVHKNVGEKEKKVGPKKNLKLLNFIIFFEGVQHFSCGGVNALQPEVSTARGCFELYQKDGQTNRHKDMATQ